MRFEVRRDAHRTRTILLLSGGFAVFSVLAFLVGGAVPGTTLLIVSGVILIFFTFDQSKIGWYYEVGETELVIRRTMKRYSIAGSRLAKVGRVGWSGVWEAVTRHKKHGDPAGTGNRQVALGRLIGFCTVSIPVRGRRPAGREQFVIVTRSNGREYILSPLEVESFVRECQRLISRSRS